MWGFVLNPVKTKGMAFSLCSYPSPHLSIGSSPIEFVKVHKYLGLYFDSPRLLWKPHISYLNSSCLSKVNLLRSISGASWGADRHVLLKFYTALIRAKLDYGSIFYETASQTSLAPLTRLQNVCLRIALGVWSTTPVLSLEAESDISPLHVHRQMVIFKYFSRFLELPGNISVIKDLMQSYDKMHHIQWTSPFRVAPLVVRSRKLLLAFGIPYGICSSQSLISPMPPWFNPNVFITTDFADIPVRFMSPKLAQRIFAQLWVKEYQGYLAIYTDGSLVLEPAVSVGAAIAIHQDATFHTSSWRLPKYFSVLSAELYAIFCALTHINLLRYLVQFQFWE